MNRLDKYQYTFFGLLFAIIILLIPLFIFLVENPSQQPPKPPTFNITVTEYVIDEALQAELDALKSKSTALEEEIRGLVLERGKMVVEKNSLLARVAQLTANQQPEMAEQYSQLKDRYNRQTAELSELKATRDALVLEYEELVRAHALCEEED